MREVGHIEEGWTYTWRKKEETRRERERERERPRKERDLALAQQASCHSVESEQHHLVNSRVLFPSASTPIGLRCHGGRSSSSSYFVHSSMLRLVW